MLTTPPGVAIISLGRTRSRMTYQDIFLKLRPQTVFSFDTYIDEREPNVVFAFTKDYIKSKKQKHEFYDIYNFNTDFFDNVNIIYNEAKEHGIELLEIREFLLEQMYKMCNDIEADIEITDMETNSLHCCNNRVRREK